MMVDSAILERIWSRKLIDALEHPYLHMRSQRVFCAFNAITDAVVHFDRRTLERELRKCDHEKIKAAIANPNLSSIETKEEFFAALLKMFSAGKAIELPSFNPKLFVWFKRIFKEEIRMGGQAGIISNQMAKLGVNTVCYSPVLSKEQSKLYFNNSLYFPIIRNERLVFRKPRASYRDGDSTKTNWIFEFRKGDRIRFGKKGLVCPRSNRIIVASRPKKYLPLFPIGMDGFLPQLSSSFDVFFLAGFQSFQQRMEGKHFRSYLNKLIWQLKQLHQNKNARFHLEYVAIHDPLLDKTIYPALLPHFDSLGINEVETIHFLRRLEEYDYAERLEHHESALNFYKSLLRLFHRLRLKRLHGHTLGYFMLLLRKDYAGRIRPQEFVNALLFASRVADGRAFYGKTPSFADIRKLHNLKISKEGIEALRGFASGFFGSNERARKFLLNGILEAEDHLLIMVPTALVKPKATVGLGDTISSVAFASEPF